MWRRTRRWLPGPRKSHRSADSARDQRRAPRPSRPSSSRIIRPARWWPRPSPPRLPAKSKDTHDVTPCSSPVIVVTDRQSTIRTWSIELGFLTVVIFMCVDLCECQCVNDPVHWRWFQWDTVTVLNEPSNERPLNYNINPDHDGLILTMLLLVSSLPHIRVLVH